MPADDLQSRLHDFILQHDLLRQGQRVVVGVSGGIDSVVLLDLLRHDYRPLVAHVHHGLRPDADQDAAFVAELAASWKLEARTLRVDVPPGASRQAQARRARYRALDHLAAEEDIDAVAVAHQRDDVAETLLLQLARGAGPRGWRAMPAARPIRTGSSVRLVRPLRFAHRHEIAAHAEEQGLPWREDPSNQLLAYRRAVVRKRVLPLLKKHFGEGVAERLAAAAELAEAYSEAGAALAPADALRRAEVEPGALSVAALADLAPVVRRGLILEVLATQHPEVPRSARAVEEIEALLGAQPGRRVEIGEVVVWRERDVLRFTRASVPPAFAAALAIPGRVQTPWGTLTAEMLEQVPGTLTSDPLVEVVDADQLGGQLLLRTWVEGDRFRPLGMEGSKKISDLLTERRVPSSERARHLVLSAGDEIVWVVGHRLAEAARLRPESRRAARLRWQPAS